MVRGLDRKSLWNRVGLFEGACLVEYFLYDLHNLIAVFLLGRLAEGSREVCFHHLYQKALLSAGGLLSLLGLGEHHRFAFPLYGIRFSPGSF